MEETPMSRDTDDHLGRSAPASEGADAPLRAKKPWRAPMVITATHLVHTNKSSDPYEFTSIGSLKFGPS
jgi:hypothetical protein